MVRSGSAQVGPRLFAGCALGRVTIEAVSRERWPFYGATIMALLIVTYVPALPRWRPALVKV